MGGAGIIACQDKVFHITVTTKLGLRYKAALDRQRTLRFYKYSCCNASGDHDHKYKRTHNSILPSACLFSSWWDRENELIIIHAWRLLGKKSCTRTIVLDNGDYVLGQTIISTLFRPCSYAPNTTVAFLNDLRPWYFSALICIQHHCSVRGRRNINGTLNVTLLTSNTKRQRRYASIEGTVGFRTFGRNDMMCIRIVTLTSKKFFGISWCVYDIIDVDALVSISGNQK